MIMDDDVNTLGRDNDRCMHESHLGVTLLYQLLQPHLDHLLYGDVLVRLSSMHLTQNRQIDDDNDADDDDGRSDDSNDSDGAFIDDADDDDDKMKGGNDNADQDGNNDGRSRDDDDHHHQHFHYPLHPCQHHTLQQQQ